MHLRSFNPSPRTTLPAGWVVADLAWMTALAIALAQRDGGILGIVAIDHCPHGSEAGSVRTADPLRRSA
jgi:hypothetical protein